MYKSTYLFYDGSYYKIGESNRVHTRLETLRAGNINLHVLAFGKNTPEKEMHKKYADYRVEGEWFDLPKEVVPQVIQEITGEESIEQLIKEDEEKIKLMARFISNLVNYGETDIKGVMKRIEKGGLRFFLNETFCKKINKQMDSKRDKYNDKDDEPEPNLDDEEEKSSVPF